MVRASVGHIRDLPKSKMGVDIEHNFTPEYLVPREKKKVIVELQTLAKKADLVIIATDPDREGEAIGWHLEEVLAGKDRQFVRATFHEITKSAILDAINHPVKLNMDLVNAQQARRVLDRLVGYSVSPVLWKKIRYGLSAGRVQSVALRLIAEREEEIEAFKPEEYWEVYVLVAVENTNQQMTAEQVEQLVRGDKNGPTLANSQFIAQVIEADGKAFEPKSGADVSPLQQTIASGKYQVKSVDRKERRRASLPPFTTSTMQQQAATRFGYTSKNTMRLAQQLYEEGLITYHRTDAVALSQQSLDMVRAYIPATYGASYLPAQPRYFANSSKNAQEAHEAIRPTDVKASAETVKARGLTEQHAKLYDLIWRRFVGSQMESAVYDQTTVFALAELAGHPTVTLKATGSILKFDGWMKLFPNQGDTILPSVSAAQPLFYNGHHAAQKFTQPPPRYNDASLIKTLEKEGIGRPSTYASIISVIEDRGYVERREKKFFPTAIGRAVNTFLKTHFEKIVDYKFTANMEDDLDAVSRGEKEWHNIVSEFYKPLATTIDQVVDKAERAQIPVEKTGETCPKCGATEHGEIVIRTGRFGKFRSCSRFPECDFTEAIVNMVDGVTCPLCQQGQVVIKPTRYGRDFYSCSRYPNCDWASWQKPQPGFTLTAEEWAKEKALREERRKAREAKFGKKDDKKSATKPAKKTTKKAASKTSKKKKA